MIRSMVQLATFVWVNILCLFFLHAYESYPSEKGQVRKYTLYFDTGLSGRKNFCGLTKVFIFIFYFIAVFPVAKRFQVHKIFEAHFSCSIRRCRRKKNLREEQRYFKEFRNKIVLLCGCFSLLFFHFMVQIYRKPEKNGVIIPNTSRAFPVI